MSGRAPNAAGKHQPRKMFKRASQQQQETTLNGNHNNSSEETKRKRVFTKNGSRKGEVSDDSEDEREVKRYQKDTEGDDDIENNEQLKALLKGSSEIIEQRISFVKAQLPDNYENVFSKMKPINGTSTNVFVYDHQADNSKENSEKHTSKSSTSSSATPEAKKGDDIEHNKELDPPNMFLIPREKIISLNSWTEIKKIGPGLQNLGNTCFMNAALQCLMYTPALRNFLLSRKIGEQSKKFNALDAMSLLAREMFLGNETSSGRSSRSNVVSPGFIAKHLKGIGGFVLGYQEDAHEFIVQLLDKMENAIVEKYKGKMDNIVLETNPVHQVFGGYLRSQIKTMETNYISNKYDAFIDIELQLNNCTSVEKSFQNYITPDRLDGKNKYKCPKTNTYVTASKKLTIHEAPINLILQLKRFNIFGKKVSKKISYEDTLDISPYMSNKNTVARYSLYGVLVHSGGSSSSGHYYSFVKNSNGIWYRMDDSSVTQVSQNTALGQQAYMLFYSRNMDDFKSDKCTAIFKESVKKWQEIQSPSSTSSSPATGSSDDKMEDDDEKESVIRKKQSNQSKQPTSTTTTIIDTNNTSATTNEEKASDSKKPTNLSIPKTTSTSAKLTTPPSKLEPPSPFYAPIRIDILEKLTPQKLQVLKSMRSVPPINIMRGVGGLLSPITLSSSSSSNIEAMWVNKNHLDGLKKNIVSTEKLFRVNVPSTPIKTLNGDDGKPQNPFSLDNYTSDSPIFSPSQTKTDVFEKKGQKRKFDDYESDQSGSDNETSEEPTTQSVKISANQLFKGASSQYSEDVDVWDDEETQEKAKQQKIFNEKVIAPKVFGRDEYDRALDAGKTKKIRKKQNPEDWEDSNFAFQQVSERKHKRK
ncbi:ubiquitin specific protease [Naegleria gruberi]|uniref:Ubiquitin carboxyl-terminal hydrolase n=1 Tax=Naegleria gruberi TaxID=5762 RepID=D2V2L3_NAEGR|nr:ubiquitin specific protease [Naegleria gruberi]EFC49081.1 ubiquitin specific protease [Naegleria gruberi]|eukprot:XP_002681825.1 ubiquitin specific protease [Naegleria gruberi strain NEG-M]